MFHPGDFYSFNLFRREKLHSILVVVFLLNSLLYRHDVKAVYFSIFFKYEFLELTYWCIFHSFSVTFCYIHAHYIYLRSRTPHSCYIFSLFSGTFFSKKVVWTRQNLLPSAEHLLSAQQSIQQYAHELRATVLQQLPNFGSRFDCLLVSIVKCVPLNYHARDFFERVVVPRWTYRDYDSVPRAAQLLSVKHNEWACCCHHFVIQLLYSSRNNYPVSVFLLTESFYLCSSITSKT